MTATRNQMIDRLKHIDDLPTIPLVMNKLNQALSNPDCNASEIEQILLNDPTISTRLLKTVNSPLFAAPGVKISDLKSAIARLGFKEVRNIALSTSVFKMFDSVEGRLFNREDFWKHCLCTSLAAIEIGSHLKERVSTDELHLAGLLHDVGKIVLDAWFSPEFEQCLALSLKAGLPLFKAELVAMEIDHAEIGAIIAEEWHLPEVAIQAIRYHHCPQEASPEYQNVVKVVQLANYLVNTNELGCSGDFSHPAFDRSTWESLNIDPAMVPKIVENVTEKSSDLANIF